MAIYNEMDELSKLELEFDWDEGNKHKNWIKHKVSHLEAEEIFLSGSGLLGKDEKHSTSESRYKFLGRTSKKRYLVAFFTIRKGKIRIISVRPMGRKDKIKYDQEKI
jgi:uncharacterized DUF497 family protein